MAIGRTASRRKSSAVLRWLSLSPSGSWPATAMPPQRLRLNVPSHTSDRNLILDAFVFILPSSSEISLFERILPRIGSTCFRQHPSPEEAFQATRYSLTADVVTCRAGRLSPGRAN